MNYKNKNHKNEKTEQVIKQIFQQQQKLKIEKN